MTELVIRRERKQARYFVEKLEDETSLDMILVPGGAFVMGSPDDEPERYDNEGPQHRVSVPTFFMGRYPVTQAQWRAVAALPEVNQSLDVDPSHFKGENRPVENVSWYDAVEFCARLSAHTTRPYRLPSEAEWEYACRAGTTTPFYFGKTIITQLVNYNGRAYNEGATGEDRGETTPVDLFEFPNAWGLSDLHGNVWEWCADHWHRNYEEAPTDGSVWLRDNENAGRVRRGGSWGSSPRRCRSATRNISYPREPNSTIGFRVVCSAPGSLP